MDQECGEELLEIHIKENGNSGKQKVLEFIHGLMEINMKGNLKIV
jgi:hypothetical protein